MDTTKGLLVYYLIGGKMYIGRKEMTLELLRKDSILKELLGIYAGNSKSLLSKSTVSSGKGDEDYMIDFSSSEDIKLEGEPVVILNELTVWRENKRKT